MSKTSKHQKENIGGFDETYLDKLDPTDPEFLEKYIKAASAPIDPKEENKE